MKSRLLRKVKQPVLSGKRKVGAGCQWLMPVILATREAENRRITV
jgi:hypothetical protein